MIDYHAESRYLLVKTLRRKFPHAMVHESEDPEKAIEIARAVNLSAIITHRTFEMEGNVAPLPRNPRPPQKCRRASDCAAFGNVYTVHENLHLNGGAREHQLVATNQERDRRVLTDSTRDQRPSEFGLNLPLKESFEGPRAKDGVIAGS